MSGVQNCSRVLKWMIQCVVLAVGALPPIPSHPTLRSPHVFHVMNVFKPSLFFADLPCIPYSAAYRPISALSVSEKLVYRFHFLVLACFSNTRFTPPFAVATAPIRVLVAGKSCSHPEIVANTSTHLEITPQVERQKIYKVMNE